MKRVTKPQGLVIIADYRPPSRVLARLIHAVLGRFESRYYHSFITKGIAWYASQLALSAVRREVRVGGVAEMSCATSNNSPFSGRAHVLETETPLGPIG